MRWVSGTVHNKFHRRRWFHTKLRCPNGWKKRLSLLLLLLRLSQYQPLFGNLVWAASIYHMVVVHVVDDDTCDDPSLIPLLLYIYGVICLICHFLLLHFHPTTKPNNRTEQERTAVDRAIQGEQQQQQ